MLLSAWQLKSKYMYLQVSCPCSLNHNCKISYTFLAHLSWSVRVAERLVLPTSVHGVAGSNPARGEIFPKPKLRFIAQSLSCSSFHHLEMTEILLKGHKTITHHHHLSWRLTRWAYSIPMVCRQSVVHTFKLEYLRSQLANIDQILCVASLGWGKGCIRFWGSLDQNSGFHGNRKPPLTYNGENDVHLFAVIFDLILFILAGNEDMHKILKDFEFRPDWTTDYGVSCPWASKKFPYNGKMLSPC